MELMLIMKKNGEIILKKAEERDKMNTKENRKEAERILKIFISNYGKSLKDIIKAPYNFEIICRLIMAGIRSGNLIGRIEFKLEQKEELK